MIGLTCRRQALKLTKKAAFNMALPVRGMSSLSLRHAETDRSEDMYKVNIPLTDNRINLEVGVNDTLQDLESNIKSHDQKISNVDFYSVDGMPGESILPKSENLSTFENIPFLLTVDGKDSFVVNLSERHTGINRISREDIFEPNEEAFHMYCKSIGIPNKSSETLSAFLDKVYAAIPTQTASTEDIKGSIFNALASFRSLPKNQWGTTKVPELKKILDEKEAKLVEMNIIKEKLDKKALRRANLLLYTGGTVMFAQFSFIMGGTYLYFCWDVMEPMAYLMLTSNLTVAFGYYWLNKTELDYQPLQDRFKSRIALRFYRRNQFDYDLFLKLRDEVIDLRNIINNSV